MTELCEVYSDLRPEDNAVADPVVGLFCAAKYPGTLTSVSLDTIRYGHSLVLFAKLELQSLKVCLILESCRVRY